jgi:hypothetical protein
MMLKSFVNTVSVLGLAAVPIPPALVYALIASSFSKYSVIAFADVIVRYYIYAPVFMFWILVLAIIRVPVVVRSVAAGCLMFLPKWLLFGLGSNFGLMLDLLSG